MTLILTNKLKPSDFGLFTSSVLFIGFMTMLTESAISSVIIKKRRLQKQNIHSYFTFLLISSIIFTTLTIIITPFYIKSFLSTSVDLELISDIIYVSAFQILLSNIFLIPNTLMQKYLFFKRYSHFIVSLFLSSVISIYFVGSIGIWALVIKYL